MGGGGQWFAATGNAVFNNQKTSHTHNGDVIFFSKHASWPLHMHRKAQTQQHLRISPCIRSRDKPPSFHGVLSLASEEVAIGRSSGRVSISDTGGNYN